jgi:hypothetical protein
VTDVGAALLSETLNDVSFVFDRIYFLKRVFVCLEGLFIGVVGFATQSNW